MYFPQKNRALACQAGLKTENFYQETKFPVSEYQREYEWKKFAVGESPLLNAEKIVFDSHTNIPRFVRDKVPRKTEYQSKFAETRRVAKKEYENKDENLNDKGEGMFYKFINLTLTFTIWTASSFNKILPSKLGRFCRCRQIYHLARFYPELWTNRFTYYINSRSSWIRMQNR